MKIEKRDDGYWVTAIPECGDCGPYPDRASALETKDGLARTFKYMDEPGFITTDPPRKN